jgi:hypothetical protein
MPGATLRIGKRKAAFGAAALALALFQTSCVILPARITSGVEGIVVDAVSGEGIADAIVVVRFDGRFGDVLPDREVLGHREAHTDASGKFRIRPLVRAGLSAWPLYKTDQRIVTVIKDSFRCATPVAIRHKGGVKIPLRAALDPQDQRESCRPVPSNRGETEAYMTAWRALFPDEGETQNAENDRQLARLLDARSALGFGENCVGPVTDLALAPDGRRAGYSSDPEKPEVHLVELAPDRPRSPKPVAYDDDSPARRLAWTSAGDLVLWEPSPDAQRAVSPSIFGSDRFEVVWNAPHRRGAAPAAPDFRSGQAATESPRRHTPLEPADLNDEADSRWLGRSFSLKRSLDPDSGLARERLSVVRENGTRYDVPLPGEACGAPGRFGRPHYRIAADTEAGIDLRFVDGGCHAVAIDLETGAWTKLDQSPDDAVCSTTRTIPASSFNTALRSYARDVEKARGAAGADVVAAYALIIAPDGSTHAESRNHMGAAVSADVPNFPLATPLRRINVSLVGTVQTAPLDPPPPPAPVKNDLEPL